MICYIKKFLRHMTQLNIGPPLKASTDFMTLIKKINSINLFTGNTCKTITIKYKELDLVEKKNKVMGSIAGASAVGMIASIATLYLAKRAYSKYKVLKEDIDSIPWEIERESPTSS